jgi:hypothetical protein
MSAMACDLSSSKPVAFSSDFAKTLNSSTLYFKPVSHLFTDKLTLMLVQKSHVSVFHHQSKAALGKR